MAIISGGVKISGFISPTDSTDTYAVIDPIYGVDGLRNVGSIADRDAITSARRRTGMIVGVQNGAYVDYYVLNSGNTTWSQIQMVTGLTWDLGSYDLTLNTFGGGITKNLSILASDVTVTGGTYNSTSGIVTFSSNTTNARTGLFYAGNWSASSAYTSSTVVTYTVNGLDYYSIANVGPSVTPPTGDTTNWRPLSSRGVFSVTGFTSGYTNIYTTAATYNQTSGEIPLSFTDLSKNLTITGVTSIYGKDDSLKSNRVVDLNSRTLNFSSSTAPNTLTVTSGGSVGIGVLSASTKLHVSAATDPIRIQGIAASSDSNVLTIDTSGVVHTISVASLSSTLTTLYTGNGSLSSNRVVDLNDKTLNFSSSTTPNTLVLSGGNVGIGTATPQFPLHIITSASTIRYEHDVAGGALFISGNTDIPRFDIGAGTDIFSFGVVASGATAASYSSRGKATDSFVRASVSSNGLNIINAGSSLTVENYIRFYAGKNADQGDPDLHIHGLSGTTRGFVGVNVPNPTNRLHVSASTNPVRFDGLSTTATTDYAMVTTDSSGVLRAFTGGTNRIPFFNSSNQITTSSEFMYQQGGTPNNSAATLVLPTVTPAINFGQGRVVISSPGIPNGLNLELAAGAGSLNTPSQFPDVSKTFLFRNKPWNTLLTMGHYAQPSSKFLNSQFVTFSAPYASFGGQVIINASSAIGAPNPIRSFWGTAGSAFNVLGVTYTEANSTVTPATRGDIVANSFQVPTFSANTTVITTTNTYSTIAAPLIFYSASTLGVIQSVTINDSLLNNFYNAGLFTLPSLGTSPVNTTSSLNETLSASSTGYIGVSYTQAVAQTGATIVGFFTGVTTGTTTYFTGVTTGVTYSSLTNVYIAGAPNIGNNVSGTTYALKVETGTTYFGGNVTLSGISSGNTSQILTRQSNGNIAFRSISDIGGNVVGNAGTTLYWYDENHIPPTTAPTATGNGAIAIGDGAQALASGTFSFGNSAGVNVTAATNSIFIGGSAGANATGSSSSIFVGFQAGQNATGSTQGIFIGLAAGSGSRGAGSGVFIGNSAGRDASNSVNAVFIGQNAGVNAEGSSSSTFVGNQAGVNASGSSNSTFIGNSAGINARDANTSSFFGQNAGFNANNSSTSNFIGYQAGINASGTTNTIMFGNSAGAGATNGSNSIFIGDRAGSGLTTSSGNIIIGSSITMSAGSTGRICIGGVIFGTGAHNSTSGAITSAKTDGAISIGVIQPHSSAILDLTSTSKGFLPPRMLQSSRTGVTSPAEGLIVYQTNTTSTSTGPVYEGAYIHDGSTWQLMNLPYKRYVAIIEVNSSNTLVTPVQVLENELGGNVTVTYDTINKYVTFSSSGLFTADKTGIFATPGASKGDITTSIYGYIYTNIVDNSSIQLGKINSAGALSDRYYTMVEIRVYK